LTTLMMSVSVMLLVANHVACLSYLHVHVLGLLGL
jgi:hypothetical protein